MNVSEAGQLGSAPEYSVIDLIIMTRISLII
jgi:hypothetical protein